MSVLLPLGWQSRSHASSILSVKDTEKQKPLLSLLL